MPCLAKRSSNIASELAFLCPSVEAFLTDVLAAGSCSYVSHLRGTCECRGAVRALCAARDVTADALCCGKGYKARKGGLRERKRGCSRQHAVSLAPQSVAPMRYIPWSRSSLMSSMCSMPTLRRMRSLVTPDASCSSSLSCWWVVEAGWMTSVLASPTLARLDASFKLSTKAEPAFASPLMPNERTPPKPFYG